VLDEPTNDLDIDTLDLLEDLLQDYAGTVFLVSHDRAFLDAIVTQTIAAEGDGTWHEYAGGYSDWAAYQAARRESQRTEKAAEPQKSAPAGRREERVKSVKLSWKEQRELETLPDRIAALETEQAALTARLEDPALYANPQEAQAVSTRLAAIETELLELLERWEALEARQT
jgi:ATP-binding cassette subfamily F protein uup